MLTPSQGRVTFDPVSRLLSWTVGRVEQSKLPNLRGSLSLQTGAPPPDANPAINLQYERGRVAEGGGEHTLGVDALMGLNLSGFPISEYSEDRFGDC